MGQGWRKTIRSAGGHHYVTGPRNTCRERRRTVRSEMRKLNVAILLQPARGFYGPRRFRLAGKASRGAANWKREASPERPTGPAEP
jgi:hypothetical protein